VNAKQGGAGASGPELPLVQGVHSSYRQARAAAVQFQREVNERGLEGRDIEA
jgi:hypothetical protein